MELLIAVLVVLFIALLSAWLVDLLPVQSNVKPWAKFVILFVALLYIVLLVVRHYPRV